MDKKSKFSPIVKMVTLSFLVSSLLLILLLPQVLPHYPYQPVGQKTTLGKPCTSEHNCSTKINTLICGDHETCVCRDEADMIFSSKENECFIRSGRECKPKYLEGIRVRVCVENGHCNENGYCNCDPNAHESETGTCVLKFQHGTKCSKKEECDSSVGLDCGPNHEGLMQCVCPAIDAIYDPTLKKCVGKIGTDFKEYGDCVVNASDVHGKCACDFGLLPTVNGTCKQLLPHGENCTHSEECVTHMICSNGICTCNETDYIFDARRSKCVVKAGHICEVDIDGIPKACVDNAKCIRNFVSEDKCECKSGFVGRNGTCYGEYDAEPCSAHSPCLENFTCIDEVCRCPFIDHQRFDESLGSCVSGFRGPCFERSIGEHVYNFTCDEHSMLECREENGVYQCLCKTGYIESSSSFKPPSEGMGLFHYHCKVAHGYPCRLDEDCDDAAGLRCWNETCSCGDFEEYDASQKLCTGLFGAICQHKYVINITCSSGAVCKPSRALDGPSICECLEGHKADANRRCKPN